MEYTFGSPDTLLGDNDQNFYGYYEKTLTTVYDKLALVQYKAIQYTDAFGRLRREEVGESMNLKTKYEYDEQSRLIAVVNPAGDTTRYWYDNFGRVKYKYQPDMGYISYAYDKLGQVRFVQTQQQANEGKMTFTEYDDLGRVTLVGETRLTGESSEGGGVKGLISGSGGTGVTGERSSLSPVANPVVDNTTVGAGKRENTLSFPPHDMSLKLDRLTDLLSGTFLHDDGVSTSPTANKTIWLSGGGTPPMMWDNTDLAIDSTCVPLAAPVDTVFPYLFHPVLEYTDSGLKLSDTSDFENIALHPGNARIVVHYDELPTSQGAVWLYFPNRNDWENLAPHRLIRNTKGHEVAVAYRQHAGEPYHYVVMSYDERGRVEALLRYTENLGFDAVYYTYNSMNAITSITAADPLRQYTTWYGYNHNGQVDSVWTKLSIAGQGLGVDKPMYPTPQTKPTTADIVYNYTKRGQINTMSYPPVNTVVNYAYNHRAFLDSMVALKNGAMLFRQIVHLDSLGLMAWQKWQHAGESQKQHNYTYNHKQWLMQTYDGGTYNEVYNYDPVGNRTSSSGASYSTNYFYQDATGPNRLSKTIKYSWSPTTRYDTTTYSYNADGAMTDRLWTDGTQHTKERFIYDNVQGVVKNYQQIEENITADWRYRYSASGEREQKRQYRTQGATPAPGELDWTYYLLDGAKRQLAVYEGVVTKQTSCGSTTEDVVYMFPVEYLTMGIDDVPNLTTRPINPTTGVKKYKIQDYLGSIRVVIDGGGTVTSRTDYEPFGKVLWQSGQQQRLSWIGKEKDKENGLGDFGARKYDEDNARFLSVDPLWEKYRTYSPYNYCGNNPLMLRDPTGFGWFGNFLKDSKDVVTGAFDAAASDLTGQDITTGDRSSELYNASKTAGHVVIALAGTTMVETGTGEIVAGVVLAPETGGVSLVVSGVGTTQVVAGTYLAGNAIGNLMKMQGEKGGGESQVKTMNQLQKMVEKGQTPKTIERFDKGKAELHEKEHVHLKDGRALNRDGTWKHGSGTIDNKTWKFLEQQGGWVRPKE